jgi:hypothetical protein
MWLLSLSVMMLAFDFAIVSDVVHTNLAHTNLALIGTKQFIRSIQAVATAT